VMLMPPAAAKRFSPLDNSLFNIWRQKVLSGGPLRKANIVRKMSDAWNEITESDIDAQYKNCALKQRQDVYFDCPNPAEHKHGKRGQK
jgi:hypothetical protein